MPSRFAARLLTGPLAFLVGGVLDLGWFAVASVRQRMRERAQAGAARTDSCP